MGQGYSQCQSSHTLFFRRFASEKLYILVVYVDDIIVIGNYEEEVTRIKEVLNKEFKVKDLGALRYFLEKN